MTAIFDRDLLRLRRARAQHAPRPAEYLVTRMAGDLAERLGAVTRSFDLALAIGAPSAIALALDDGMVRGKIGTLLGCDLVAPAAPPHIPAFVADEERLPIAAGSLDLVLSAGVLQWTNDLPGTLVQIRSALKPDGLFLGALVGGESLTELRQAFIEAEAEIEGGASPRVAPMIDVRDLGGLLQRAGFALPVTDVDSVTVTFPSPFALLADLRAMGATSILHERRKIPLRRQVLFKAMEIYAAQFSDADGRVRATFDILHAAGWVPHPSQQKPLKPGSAMHKLADALSNKH